MTRTPHDEFAKYYLSELLEPLGKIEISRQLKSETRYADLWFSPDPATDRERQRLGLLGRLVDRPCLIEPFRNPAAKSEARSCLGKLFSLFAELERKAKREKQSLKEDNLPLLWILVPTASLGFRKGLGAKKRRAAIASGIYDFPEIYRGGLIVIHQLPRNEDTLWLRLLGRGQVQKQAIEEFTALPESHPLRENVEELLGNWRAVLESRNRLTDEEEELIVNLSPAYLQRREEWKREGIEQGIEQGIIRERRTTIEALFRNRFGSLDEPLLQVLSTLLRLSDADYGAVLPQLFQMSSEELIDRFSEV